MKRARLNRLLTAVGVFVVGSAAAAALFTLAGDSINVWRDPSDVLQLQEPERLMVGGLVVEGSVEHDDGLQVTFAVTDTQSQIDVVYHGILPDLFAEGQGVMAEGTWDGKTLQAERVLARHDENYTAPQIESSLQRRSEKSDRTY